MLKLTNISKTFNPGTEDAKLALDNVSLHVRPGDFISIIGANGAGTVSYTHLTLPTSIVV